MSGMWARVLSLTVLMFAGGCRTAPVIADISDSAIVVQQLMTTPMADVVAEAERGCALYGKKSKQLSYTCVDGYCFTKRHLFACTGPMPVRSVPAAPSTHLPTPMSAAAQAPQSRVPDTALPVRNTQPVALPPPPAGEPVAAAPRPPPVAAYVPPPRPTTPQTAAEPAEASGFEVHAFEE